GVLMVALLLSALIRDSRFGAALQAARQNEVRVASVGIAPFRIKLAAFVISGMMTALAGALYADLNRFVSPSMLSWHMSGEFIVLIILGGVGRLCGPLAGAMLFVMFEYTLRSERVASVGIAPFRIKLAAFVISGMMTALAGALYADLNRFVSPSMLSWHMSGEFIVLIILGGVGRLCGPLAGAMLFVMFEYIL